jgi:hypothetical protein
MADAAASSSSDPSYQQNYDSKVQSKQPHLSKQDLATLNVAELNPLSPMVISRQATINIGARVHLALCARSLLVAALWRTAASEPFFSSQSSRALRVLPARRQVQLAMWRTANPRWLRPFLACT